VREAIRHWASEAGRKRQDVLRIGYFGSYARGDWGVGSDLDVVIILESSEQPFERRGVEWDGPKIPVPTDVLVYTKEEWQTMMQRGNSCKTLMSEIVWVYSSLKCVTDD